MGDLTASEIKDILTIAKPVIDPLISTFITPKIVRLKEWVTKQDIKNKVIDNAFENKFAEYLARTYDRCQQINVLIFPNRQIRLTSIYLPLTIISKGAFSVLGIKEEFYSSSSVSLKIDSFSKSDIEPFKKILISDSAGMGKSTLSKWICMKTLENNLAIPVLIELRNLKANYTILDEIYDQLNPIDQVFDKELIIKFLELGQFLIILDGFDELPNDNIEQIIKDIRRFIDKTPENWFIMTSRPEGALTSFGDFELFNIKPLKTEEAFALIRKYDVISPVKVGESLIVNIQNKLGQVSELLTNPFLVSLLYSVYAFNKDIPDDKVTFYEEIFQALYKKHDLSKDGWTRPKKSKLSILQFKILLRQLAFDTARKGQVTYSESEILEFIEAAKAKCPGINTNADDFLDDLLKAVPLFQRDGLKIKWGHKSIQDFFASDFINYSAKKEQILHWILNVGREGFLNVIDFYIEQDFNTFRKVVIYKLLKEFISHFESSYNNIKCVSQADINERRTLTFDIEILFTNNNSPIKVENILDYAEKIIPGYNTGGKDGFISTVGSQIRGPLVISSFKTELLFQIANKIPNNDYLIYRGGIIEDKVFNFNLPEDRIYVINDDPNNPINSSENFSEINSMIKEIGPYYQAHFSYPEAKKELQKIEQEIEKEKKSQESFDF